MKSLEQLGRAAGWVLAAPPFAALSAARRARSLHPHGILLEGECDAMAPPEDLVSLADALSGPVLARLSGAIWKRPGTHLPDVLGCALRIDGEQDLLFATIKRPWTTPFAPLTTDVDDFLANFYYGVSPFRCPGVRRRFWMRLRPIRTEVQDGPRDNREDRLLLALGHADVGFGVDVSYRPRVGWREVARVTLERLSDRNEEKLRFDPFLDGRGIRPTGMIHALRHGAYAASRTARTLVRPD